MSWDDLENLTPAEWLAMKEACMKHLAGVDEETRKELIVRYGKWLKVHEPPGIVESKPVQKTAAKVRRIA